MLSHIKRYRKYAGLIIPFAASLLIWKRTGNPTLALVLLALIVLGIATQPMMQRYGENKKKRDARYF